MFEPGEIVYAFVKSTHPPKYKYFVTVYKDENLQIVTCFTTTKNRVGVPLEILRHGYVKKEDTIMGYFYDKNVEVGVDLQGNPFKFPRDCVIPFGYGIQVGSKEQFLANVCEERVVCKLNDEEYVNLVYAMYKSPLTNSRFKPYLEKILNSL